MREREKKNASLFKSSSLFNQIKYNNKIGKMQRLYACICYPHILAVVVRL